MDANLVLVGMNEAYLNVTRRTREEIIGRHVFDAFPSDPQSLGGRQLRESLQRVLKSGEPDELALIPYATERPGAEPEFRFWSATHTPLLNAEGRVEFIVQHTEDVTELVQLREAQHAKDIQRQQEMLSRAAHVEERNRALSAETDLLRSLFAQAPSFMALLSGRDHVFELANDSYLRLTGDRALVGKSVAEAMPEVVDQGFIRLLNDVWDSGVPYVGRSVPVVLLDDAGVPGQRYLDFIYQPIRDSKGQVRGIFVQGQDVTEHKLISESLARRTEMLRLAQNAGGVGTFEWDIATRMLVGSETMFDLYGIPGAPGPVPVDLFSAAVHPEDRVNLTTNAPMDGLAQAARRTEYRVVLPNGDERWLVRQGEVVHDESGNAVRIVGAAYDITERKEAEAQTRLLMQELAHRVKNMLAVFSAITTQTLRTAGTLDGARVALEQRLAALALAQDTLIQGAWSNAAVRDVVEGAVRLIGPEQGRISIHGPALMLDSRAVLGLALLLHELGTNAIKYGSLSQPDGRVDISWEETSDTETPMLRLVWRESGGPTVVQPTRRGFGSRLIERGLVTNLGGEVRLDYRPEGLVCEADVRIVPAVRRERAASPTGLSLA